MIGFYAAGAMGQGGGPGPGPGPFDPTILSGLTFAFATNHDPIWKGASTTSGASTADGDPARRLDSPYVGRTMFHSSSGFTLETSEFGAGLNAVRGVDTPRLMYPLPVGTDSPSGILPIGDMFSTTEKVLIWAGAVDSAAPDGTVYTLPAILRDAGGYCGLHCGAVGGDIRLHWYSWDSGVKVTSLDVPVGTPCVIVCRHDGGNLRIARDGVAWGSPVAAGATTGGMTFQVNFGGGPSTAIRTAAFVTCNAANSDADILTVVKQMGALVGLSL